MECIIRGSRACLDHKIITLDIVRAGLHCSFKISRQMLPLLLILGWKTFVLKATCTNHSSEACYKTSRSEKSCQITFNTSNIKAYLILQKSRNWAEEAKVSIQLRSLIHRLNWVSRMYRLVKLGHVKVYKDFIACGNYVSTEYIKAWDINIKCISQNIFLYVHNSKQK